MLELQRDSIEKQNQSELFKKMYDRVTNFLPEKELEILRTISEVEKLSLYSIPSENFNFTSTQLNIDSFLNQEQMGEYTKSLKTAITQLNDENFSFKMMLERLKASQQAEAEKLARCQNENERLKNEIKVLRESKAEQDNNRAKIEYEMKTEIENYKQRIKHLENEKDELKNRYLTEINAAKIRYDNELEKQNKLMQKKYDDLVMELNKLNDILKKLQKEKTELTIKLEQFEKDRKKCELHNNERFILMNKIENTSIFFNYSNF